MSSDFIQQIEKIKKGVLENKIIWQKTGANSFVWSTVDSADRKINLVLQKVIKENQTSYLFRLWDPIKKIAIFEQISDEIDDYDALALMDLYNFVHNNYRKPGSNVLDDILNRI